MTQTNLDYLLQVTAAGATRPPGSSARGSEPSPAFGDHFTRSASAVQDPSNRAGGQNSAGQDTTQRPGNPSSHDTPQGAAQEPSGRAADRQVNNNDHAAATGDVSDRAGESSSVDAEKGVPPTGQSAGDEDNSTDDEKSNDLPDGAEQAAATAANSATINTPLATAESADIANFATQAAADATITFSATTDEDAASEKISTNALKLAADQRGLQQEPEQHTSTAQSASSGDADQLTVRPEVGKSAGTKDKSAVEASRGEGERPKVETTARQAAASELSPELEATLTGNGADGPVDELAAHDPSEDTNASADESRGRKTSDANSRTGWTATAQTAVVAAIAGKAAAQTGESSANANSAENAAQPTVKAAAPKSDALVNMLGRPNAGGSPVNRGGRAAGDDELPRVDPARFIGRVAKAFHTAQERGGTLQLRLSPPELGSIRLELTVKEGVMTAALETETAAARRVLLDHLPALRERLAEQNIRVERFDVDVRREGGGSQADDRAAQHQQHNHQPDQPPPRRQPVNQSRLGEGAPPDTRTIPTRTNDTQINLVA
jgi:flagellar hook-length control protein FliK